MVKAIRMSEAELEAYLARRKQTPSPELPQLDERPSPAPRPSKLEIRFEQQLMVEGLIDGMMRNYFFLPGRDFELDFAWPAAKVAVEVQGMSHRIKGKFKADIEKRALALLSGWKVLEVDGNAIRHGVAIVWFKELLWQVRNTDPV